MEKLCEGPHVHADFQPARFVARLQGILLPNTGRDESVANFCFNSIFEFFNRGNSGIEPDKGTGNQLSRKV
jgi:hypothetical protein